MKIAVIVYHKNVDNYPRQWIEQFKHSINSQTYKEFDILELNYGGGQERLFQNSQFSSINFPTFVHGMNNLITEGFSKGYEYILNTNVDDYYAKDRVEKQLPYMGKYDIISSNFCLVENSRVTGKHKFHKLNVLEELSHKHNVICHPVVAYSKRFWEKNKYIPEQIPYEDLKLWQRAVENGQKFIILEDNLCFHRVHSQSVCKSNNR